MKVEPVGSTATLGIAATTTCCSVDAISKASNAIPAIRPGLAASFKVS